MTFGELYLRNDGWDTHDTLVVVAGMTKTVIIAHEAYERYGQNLVMWFKGNTVIIKNEWRNNHGTTDGKRLPLRQPRTGRQRNCHDQNDAQVRSRI